MARASAKRGRRPRANARASTPVAPAETEAPAVEAPPKPPKPEPKEERPPRERRFGLRRKPKAPPRPEDQMFFTRLRTHAKWVFVLLAGAFAIGFLAFGVGAGGTGFGDAIADFFGGGDDTPSLEEAKAKVDENPTDSDALLELANVYEGRRQLAEAAATLERYVELNPDDVDTLRRLAATYASRADQLGAEQSILSSFSGSDSFNASVFSFPELSGFIGAVGQDPVVAAQASQTQAAIERLTNDQQDVYTTQVTIYEQITKLTPDDPQAFLLLGEAARNASDNDKAVEAYERFLELDPENPLADQVKEEVGFLKEDVNIVNG